MSTGGCGFGASIGCCPGGIRGGCGLCFLQLPFRQGEVKCRALAELALQPNATTVPLYHLLHDGQSNPRPLLVALQALKKLENLTEVLRLDAHAVVTDVDDVLD